MSQSPLLAEPVAIIGVGALFPGSFNANGFWKDIITGKDLITDILPSHWLIEDYYDPDPTVMDKTYCKRGAFLKHVDFDPVEYGVPPNVIPATDTSQLLALIVAKQVLTDATHGKYTEMDLSRTSVILGAAALEALQYVAARVQRPVWTKALREFGLPEESVQTICDKIANSYTPWQENTFPGLLGNVISGRIANRFNLGGTNCITDAACAGSLSALAMAVSELQLKRSDLVITGGVDTLNDIVMFMCFSKTQALSTTGDCRPFSDKANGTVLGEGLGMFALKRLTDAEAQGDAIYAVIRGIGTSSDGRSKSIYAPLAKGQSRAILRACEAAGYSPSTVELVEAHGTGTKAGDIAEFSGLKLAYNADGKAKKQQCALGSIKSQIGHTKSAAGAAGLFKAIMSLHHKTLPPTIKIDKPNPELDVENSPFYLNTTLRPWIRDKQHPRRAGVSSFGFGGSNFHVAIEEYTGNGKKALRFRTSPTELVIFSAATPQALIEQCKNLAAHVQQPGYLVYLARKSQENTSPEHLARLAIVANDEEDLRQKIDSALSTIQADPQKTFSLSKGIYYGFAADAGKVAFLFPGQGSQYLNMGSDLLTAFNQSMAKWDQIANVDLQDEYSLAEVVFPPSTFLPEKQQQLLQRLTMTQWAQPALAVTSLIQHDLLKTLGIAPDYLVGHSFGEITALYAAGAMDEEMLITIARKRGELMQNAAAMDGAMLSVAHPAAEVITLLKKANINATPANFNAPQQLVLSGTQAEIDKAEQCLKTRKIVCQRLNVATGFHSELVKPACEPFRHFLANIFFDKLKIPVSANITASYYPDDPACIKDYLADQLAKPVRFQQQIEQMYHEGVRTFIEVGPHSALSGLVNQCLVGQTFQAISLDRRGDHGLTSFWNALAKLFVAGLNPQFAALWHEYRIIDEPVTKTQKFTLAINGTNYGKPYPPASGGKELPAPKLAENQATVIQSQQPDRSSLNLKEKAMSHTNNPQLVQMYQELHRQLIDAHNSYQKVMAESHVAFLNSICHLTVPGTFKAETTMAAASPQPALVVAPQAMSITPPTTRSSNEVQQPQKQAGPPQFTQPLVTTTSVQTKVDTATPEKTKNNHAESSDLQALLLEIVVEKTGYPQEMLSMDMAIEADLGIDSIKRVEILSSIAEKAPHLPEMSPNELAEMQTLGDIVTYLKRQQSLNGTPRHA